MSQEQHNIVRALWTHNVIVEAVAGSGKTTLVQHLARTYTAAKILVLTYNSALRKDCQCKLQEFKGNAKCYTYHAFMAFLCKRNCFNDVMFLDLLQNHLQPISFHFDILVIDEMQDQRRHHVDFLLRLLEKKKKCRFLFMGDPKQLLYDFFKTDPADARYLHHADQIFGKFTESPFVRLGLSISFRSTPKICAFVNHVCNTQMVPGNTTNRDDSVKLVVCDLFSKRTSDYISSVITELEMEDVMFVSYSVSKSKSLACIVNNLSKSFKFHVTRHDQDHCASSTMLTKTNKITVDTFCGAKGRERACVFVFGVDYASTRGNSTANQIYVALTRSYGGKLFVVQDYKLSQEWLKGYQEKMEVVELKKPRLASFQREEKRLDVNNTRTFFDFIDVRKMATICSQVCQTREITPATPSTFNGLVTFDSNRTEDVTAIVGLAIPMMVEHERKGGKITSASEWLRCANTKLANKSYGHMLSQISNYEWFTSTKELNYLRTFVNLVGAHEFNIDCVHVSGKRMLKGRIDIKTNDGFPCMLEFSKELSLQQVAKAILNIAISKKQHGHLFNFQTGQHVVINISSPPENVIEYICAQIL